MGQDQSPPPSALELAQHSSDELATRRIAVFRRLLSYIIPFRGRLAWGIFFGICSGLFNAVILLVMKSVFTVVLPNDEVADDGDESRFGDAIRPFEDLPIFTDFEIPVPTLPAEQEWIFVTLVCLSIPLLLLLRGLFQFLHQYCMLWLNMKVLYNLRDQCFRGVMRQSLSFFNRVKQGELIQTVANQTRTLAEAGGHLLSGWIQHPVGILSVIVVVVIMDPLYSLGALVVFPLCILPVAAIARRVRKAGGKEEEESEGLMVTLHESFSGVRLVKANSREEYQTERFNAGSRAIVKFIMRWRKAMEISSPLVEIVGATGIVIGMVYAWVTEMQYGKFMTLNLGLISLYPHVKALSRIQVQAEKCFVAAIKVFHFIDAEPEVTDRPEATGLKKSTGLIELKDVTFAYEPENPALRNVSLRFEPGKRYALVGQSGSGKSTILSLILRFYDVDDGAVRVDTRDVRDYTQASLRENIGLVSQDTFLFHDTIANNIRYGRLDASDEEIEAAAKLAFAHDFILEQTDGYNTLLGDKGCTLSGGQQQRLSIARAILRNAPILFLDEATSALDSESERAIQDALTELSKGKTVIAIAHRLSTVLDSDEIVMMKEGEVVDVASHEVLISRCPDYKALYDLQFEGK